MEMVFYDLDQKCSTAKKELSCDLSSEAGAFEGDVGEDSKVITVAGNGKVKKSSSRCAVLLLCMLVLLFVVGILFGFKTLSFYFDNSNANREMKMVQLQTSYNNVTTERDQLQTSYMHVIAEKYQLQTSYNNLIKEKKQLQTCYDSVKQARDQLQTSYMHVIAEKYQLQTNLTKQMGQLQTSYNTLMTEKKQLQTSYDSVKQERDQLQTSYDSLQQERDQLQTSYDSLQQERDQLQTSYNSLQQERDQLQTSYNSLNQERDQLQVHLNRQTSQLQTSKAQFTQEKEQLQRRLNSLRTEAEEAERKLQDSAARLRNLTEERATMKSLLNNGWVYFGGNFYQVSSTKKSWGESRRDCQQKGADLLIINSREEQVFANQFKKYMWIGLTDVATDGVWKWVDGTKVSTSYWSSGEPNGKKSENCADIKNHGTELSWNDESCSISLFWICEKKFLQ